MSIVKTSSKGQVVIPKDIRKKVGITPGKKVLLQVVDQHVEITPIPDDPIKALKGVLKGGQSLAAKLLSERKKDDEIDEKNNF